MTEMKRPMDELDQRKMLQQDRERDTEKQERPPIVGRGETSRAQNVSDDDLSAGD